MQNHSLSAYRKYRLLIAIAALLLLLSSVLAGLTFYSAGQFAGATKELNLANQQINQIKSISQDALALHGQYSTLIAQSDSNTPELPVSMLNILENIAIKKQAVDDSFDVLLDGGVAKIGELTEELDGTQSPELRQELLLAQEHWNKYSTVLNRLINRARSEGVLVNINDLPNKVGSYGADSVAILTQYHTDLSEVIRSRSQTIRWVQIVGIFLSLLLFVGLVFGALRQLIRGDQLLDSSRREMREIMRTVNTGLFLLDKELVIGQQHSDALNGIIGSDDLGGKRFASVLRNRISDKDLQTTEDFITQLYNPRVKEKLVNSLNPLNKVVFNDGNQSRYLDFTFSRVYEEGKIARILVNVDDVSEEVRLEQRLQKERTQNDRQIEMLTTILNVSPKVINEFIYNTRSRIDKMNNVLKSSGGSQFELENKLRAIYREMHSLKGEASALKLHSFTQIASEAEDKLYSLQNQGKLSGDDFLSLTVQLDELLTLSNTISDLGERINSSAPKAVVESVMVSDDATNSEFARYLVDFGSDIAKRQEKNIEVDTSQMYGVVIPEHLTEVVKEISIQLLRNAIVHGINDPKTRVEQGKSAVGKVRICFQEQDADGNFVLTLEDDGKGIDYDAIRKKLADSGKYTLDKATSLSEAQLLGVLFSSGFSTKAVADEDGGRGVGLDIVKERIRQHHGKIHVHSEKGKYSRFVVKLPTKV